MSFFKQISIAAIIFTSSTTLAGPVVNLAPSQMTDGLSGIDNSEFIEIRGTAISDKYIDFSILADTEGDASPVLYQGTLMTRVVRSHLTGNLHFNYRIMEPSDGLAGRISHIEVGGFGDFQTRVEFRNDATSIGEEGPYMAERTIGGDIVDFTFDGGLNTADDSHFFFAMVNTDTFYEDSALATIYLESGESVSLVVDSATPVPAPGSLALLGAAGLAGARRRR
ncbi:MAG: PEP-CTERM sorting domain-containing protein [Phycisphaerales bacterium]